MPKLLDVLPPPEVVLNLEPEELAAIVMQYLHSMTPQELMYLNRNNFGGSLFFNVHVYPPTYRSLDSDAQEKISQAVMEAWFWLEREGFLAPRPGPNRDSFFITRRGQRVKNAIDLAAIRKSRFAAKEIASSANR